MAAIKLANKIN